MEKRLIIFLSIHLLCSNIYSSERTSSDAEMANYINKFMNDYVPYFLHTEPFISKLVKFIAYTAIKKPDLMNNFREVALSHCSSCTAELLDYGINLTRDDLPYDVAVCGPIKNTGKIKDCAVFILAFSTWTPEIYAQNLKSTLEIIKKFPHKPMTLELVS